MSTNEQASMKSDTLSQLRGTDPHRTRREPSQFAKCIGLRPMRALSLTLISLWSSGLAPNLAAQSSIVSPAGGVRVPASTVQAAAPAPLNSEFVNIRVADSFPGATLGHQIVAAFADLGTVRGEVWVFKEGAIDQTVAVGEYQTLRFFAGVRTMNAGRFLLSGRGSVIRGAGCENTIFDVSATTGNGVIELTSGEPSGTVEDLFIRFAQPNTIVRSQLIQHAPAISAIGQPRFRVRAVKITRAWNGIDMKGNSGGASISDVQMSAFNIGIDMDGSYDSVRVDNFHFWPFDLTPGQFTNIFTVAPTVAIQSGRMDDLHINGFLNISALGIRLYRSAAGDTFGNVTNADFDTFQGIDMSAGILSVAGAFFSTTHVPWITQSGGQLTIAGSTFFGGDASTVDGIQYSGPFGSSLTIGTCKFITAGSDRRSIASTGQDLTVSNCSFNRDPNFSYTVPTIDIASGRATIMGNRTLDKGVGPGTFVRVATDDWHRVVFNAPIGWTMDTPTAGFGIYGPN